MLSRSYSGYRHVVNCAATLIGGWRGGCHAIPGCGCLPAVAGAPAHCNLRPWRPSEREPPFFGALACRAVSQLDKAAVALYGLGPCRYIARQTAASTQTQRRAQPSGIRPRARDQGQAPARPAPGALPQRRHHPTAVRGWARDPRCLRSHPVAGLWKEAGDASTQPLSLLVPGPLRHETLHEVAESTLREIALNAGEANLRMASRRRVAGETRECTTRPRRPRTRSMRC